LIKIGSIFSVAENWLALVAERRSVAALVVVAGIAVRLAIASASHFEPLVSELQQVAVSMAQHGTIADAYRPGSGPTTHTGPVAPATAALVYWLLGSGSVAAEVVLTILAGAVIGVTALVWNAVFRQLGAPASLRGLAILFVTLVPLETQLEVQDLRARESGLAALLLSIVILAVVRLDKAERVSWRSITAIALVIGVFLLLSPAPALGAIGACGLLTLRRIHPRRWLGVGAIAATAIIALSTPWALRNQRVFGEMIWSRGNFGLEYSIGTNADSVAPADPAKNFSRTMKRVHPFISDAAYQAMQAAGGELAYARQLQRDTDAWVRTHPADAARIWVRHVAEFYVPPAWLWNPYGSVTASARVRMAVLDIIGLAGIAALLLRLAQRQWTYLYLMLPMILVALPYVALQPRLRYRYVIATLLVFLACDLLSRWRARTATST
jgi:hypothetical protein